MSLGGGSSESPLRPSYSILRKPVRNSRYYSSESGDPSFRTASDNSRRGLLSTTSQDSAIPLIEITHSPYAASENASLTAGGTGLSQQDDEDGTSRFTDISLPTTDNLDDIRPYSVSPSNDTTAASDAISAAKSGDYTKVAEVNVKEDSKPEISCLPTTSLPDWRPRSLGWTLHLSCLVTLVLVVYVLIWVFSFRRGTVIASTSGYSWLFEYGPAFLAVLVKEIAVRMCRDLESVLPYVALASKEKDVVRSRPQTQLTETSWYNNFFHKHTQRTKIIGYYCSILVVFQATLLSRGSRLYKEVPGNFDVVNPDKFLPELDQSFVSALALDSIWHGDTMMDIKWLSLIDTMPTHSKGFLSPDYAGVMPFNARGAQNSSIYGDKVEPQTWTTDTSAIYGYLDCAQINDIQVSVSDMWIGSSGLEATGLTVQFKDREGCEYKRTWRNTSSRSPTGHQNPITHDGRFALWQPLARSEGYPENSPASCVPHQHFIASGPLTVSYKSGTKDNSTHLADTSPDSGWAAISCKPRYRVLKNSIKYTVKTNQLAGDASEIFFGDGTLVDPRENFINEPMNKNLLESDLVYNLSSPVFRRTFWNKPSPNSFGTYKELYSARYLGFDIDEGCRDVSTEENEWNNDEACQMYANVATLWPALVAGTASLSALYAPLETRDITTGTIELYRTGWYLSTFELIGTILTHFFILVLITREKVFHKPNWFKFIPCFHYGRSRYRTGLYGTPTSIIGRAFVFQHPSLQPLFEGLDILERSSDAVRESRRRFCSDNVNLLLRVWTDEGGDGDGDGDEQQASYALIRPKNGNILIDDVEEPEQAEKTNSMMRWWSKMRRRKSRRDSHRVTRVKAPIILNNILLLFLFAGISAILLIVYFYIFRSKNSGFQMWYQPTYLFSQRLRDETTRYIQKALFKGLPPLVLVAFGMWWDKVERYYRETEPYLALAKGANGRKSVCLDYVHGTQILIAYKALLNGHLWLTLVTYTSIFIKIGIVLASGIFAMNEIGHKPGRELRITRDWRSNQFVDSPNTINEDFKVSLRQSAMSRAVFEYARRPGWQYQNWTYPSVELNGRQFQLNLVGISGHLECKPTDIAIQGDIASGISVSITGETCHGNAWSMLCPPVESNSHGNSHQLCMGWRYLSRKDCATTTSNAGGNWWIVSLDQTLDSNPALETAVPVYKSLLCEPSIIRDAMSVTVSKDTNDKTWIDGAERSEQIRVSPDYWSGKDNDQDFISFSSMLLNDTFTGKSYNTTDGSWFDYFSTITVLAKKENPNTFFPNEHALMKAVNETYSNVFAALISQNLRGNKIGEDDTILLELKPHNGSALTVTAAPLANMATVNNQSLLVACSMLIVYLLAILCVRPRQKRRSKLDISYPANAMTMIYDSGFLEAVRRRTTEASDIQKMHKEGFPEFHESTFAIGHYMGMSGKPRIGIDFENTVVTIGKGDRRCCCLC